MAFLPSITTTKIAPIVATAPAPSGVNLTPWPANMVPNPDLNATSGGAAAKPVGYPIT